MKDVFERSWARFSFEPGLANWAAHADRAARVIEARPAPGMSRCGGTWHVGVNAMANDADGRLAGGPPLSGRAIDAARDLIGAPFAFDRAQLSVCYPGYPKHGAEEGEAAHRYRRRRAAAHVDGLRRIMPGRRRKLDELHGFVLGLPLNPAPAGGAPFVVWEGSHEIMRAAFREAFADVTPELWSEIDVTEAYQAARRHCFERSAPVEITARPGEAYLVHRLALHGVAPWRGAASGRRAIAYFRPDPFPGASPEWWLDRR